jgi:hypothetical protein
MEQDLRYRISQDEMKYTYESAKARMDCHVERANKQKDIIAKHPFFKTEREALQAALKNENLFDYQIWAKIEKGEDGIFRIQNNWIVTDDVFVKLAAEYIGMALMYDDIRFNRIIYNNIKIDDIVAYW